MKYSDAIFICDDIDGDTFSLETKIEAIEKILGMATFNAVKKETLVKVIRWFFDNCVRVEAQGEE